MTHTLAPNQPTTRIPVRARVRRLDRVDPFAAYMAIRAARGAHDVVILESLTGPQLDARQSLILYGQVAAVEVTGTRIALSGKPALVDALRQAALASGTVKPDRHRLALGDPFDLWAFLRAVERLFQVDGPALEGGYRFGFFGYFGYDSVAAIERLPHRIEAGMNLPDVHLALYRGAVRIHHGRGTAELVDTESAYWGPVELPDLSAQADPTLFEPPPVPTVLEVTDTMTRDAFEGKVERSLEHILDGDIYQVQIGHEIRIRSPIAPIDVYRRLRHRNPAPYMYLATLGRATLIGASPEVLFRLESGRITMRPLAGTIRRGASPQEDAANVETLRNDPKEIAEHIMLVDLCRNDIGRVCLPGSLEVTDLLAVERYSHVHHLVSNVVARMAPDHDAYDLIRATFTAGTMSGAPKVRAMEIIEDLEVTRRGVYAGAVGFLDFGGDSTLALCIRTAVQVDGEYSVRASAGIVADSVPEKEWRETLAKMGAPFWAITGQELLP